MSNQDTASPRFNGTATKLLLALVAILLTAGIAHTFNAINGNADAIDNNSRDIGELTKKIEKLVAEVNISAEYNQETLIEIKNELKEINRRMAKNP